MEVVAVIRLALEDDVPRISLHLLALYYIALFGALAFCVGARPELETHAERLRTCRAAWLAQVPRA
jgi:hypothetical protein